MGLQLYLDSKAKMMIIQSSIVQWSTIKVCHFLSYKYTNNKDGKWPFSYFLILDFILHEDSTQKFLYSQGSYEQGLI